VADCLRPRELHGLKAGCIACIALLRNVIRLDRRESTND
jgi:hypothetical protein